MQQQLAQQYGATGQLSGQGFQSQLLQMQQQYGASQALQQMLAGGGLSAASQLASQGMFGANALNQAAIQGANNLFGGQLTGAQSALSNMLGLEQLGIYGGIQGFGQGVTAGGQQYSLEQQQINNAYQEFLRTQPQYNPLLGLMTSLSVGYPPSTVPGYGPSQFSQILGGASSALSAYQSLATILGIHP